MITDLNAIKNAQNDDCSCFLDSLFNMKGVEGQGIERY